MAEKSEKLFEDISADTSVHEIESLCMNCSEQGITRMMLTRIPFFKDVVVMAFYCPHCHFRDSEIQAAGAIQKKGIRFTLTVDSESALQRLILRYVNATLTIPSLEFEIPARTQRASLTTLEGVISSAVEGLQDVLTEGKSGLERLESTGQATQEELDAGRETITKLDTFVTKLSDLLKVGTPEGPKSFTVILDDPSGNSLIQTTQYGKNSITDTNLVVTHYNRTVEQDEGLGLGHDETHVKLSDTKGPGPAAPTQLDNSGWESLADNAPNIERFAGNCYLCNAPCETRFATTTIPHFKEVVLMVTQCDKCGAKDCEVKSGGAMSNKGSRITLNVIDKHDLTRDVVKSESCSVEIPELNLEFVPGVSGGRFTSVEGLIAYIKGQLDMDNPFMYGDSAQTDDRKLWHDFMDLLDKCRNNEMPFTLILDDPLNNSYIATKGDNDSKLRVEYYTRTEEQDDEYGISDMKTENYTHLENAGAKQ